MKKVISIIIGLLCVCATYAISYASPYKGSVSRHTTRTMHTSGITSMPTASMGSVSAGMMSSGSSSNSQCGINYSTTGFATCATSIRGGVTTRQTASSMNASAPNNAPRRAKQEGIDPSGNPEGLPDCGCYWYYDEGEGVWKCTVCDCEIDPYDGDYPDHCDCSPSCQCPIEWDWSVLAFLSLLSFAYIAYKKRQKMSNFVETVF